MPHEVPDVDLAELLAAAEDASPAAAVATAAAHLERRLEAEAVTFWIADAAGQRLLRITDGQPAGSATDAGTAWRDQRMVVASSVWVPVTVRGDALGVLEVRLPGSGTDGAPLSRRMRRALTDVAHGLGYVIIANQRYSDAYEVARRSEPFDLSMEIQRRLLPQAFVCEGGSFALAGWLEPSATAGGDTFDYVASRDWLTVSLIDAVGHDVQAAMLATLTVNSLRNARRDGAGVGGQATAAHRVLDRYADPESYATGILLEAPLQSTDAHAAADDGRPVSVRVVNAGHPPPRLLRAGEATMVDLPPEPPLGLAVLPGCDEYRTHELDLHPGDRLVLLTDGMYERSAEGFELDKVLLDTAADHPRNAVQHVAAALRDHVGGRPEDDATILVLDWYGGSTERSTRGGADRDS